jgi:mono/diheme cytochrome c family protein
MKSARILIMMSLILGLGVAEKTFSFQATGSQERGSADVPKGNLQRSAEILYFKRFAESGPERGKEIYFYKCWVCHNEYTRAAGTPSPTLKDLYKRPKLISGQPVNDQTVAEKIKNGGPMMPGYKYTLSDQDLADLVSFLRAGKCCWEDSEEKEPPRNPRYKAK